MVLDIRNLTSTKGLKPIGYSQTNITQVINAVIRNQYPDSEIEEFIKKIGLSFKDIKRVIESEIKKQNRTLHVFKTVEAWNEFRNANDCGESWSDDAGLIYCYKY